MPTKRSVLTVLFLLMSNILGGNAMNAGLTKNGSKKIILIRHSTTEMNERLRDMPWGSPNFVDCQLWDTRLSKSGETHVLEAHRNLVMGRHASAFSLNEIELVVSSPLTRTLQTAEYMLTHPSYTLIPKGTSKLAQPLVCERLYMSSEVGRERHELEREFPLWDYSLLPANKPWWFVHDHSTPYKEWRPKGEYCCDGEPSNVFRERMLAAKEWLLSRPENCIAVVTHWAVIRALTGESFANCEIKAFDSNSLLLEPYIDH